MMSPFFRNDTVEIVVPNGKYRQCVAVEKSKIYASVAKKSPKCEPVTVLSMEKPDLDKLLDELFKPTKTQTPLSLESISPRLPPEGQAWLNSLNPFCRQAVEHDLRWAGQDLFVKYWGSIRDTLQRLERDFGPSDNWK